MGNDTLTPYYKEHKATKKKGRGKTKKKSSQITVEATLDINQLLTQYGEEVQRRVEAEMKLHSVQVDKASNAIETSFEEVKE